jgi:metallophosphoesterase (TIGR03768 family)
MHFTPLRTTMLVGIGILTYLLASSCGSSHSVVPPVNLNVLTTRQQAILPIAMPAGALQLDPREVSLYKDYGYSAWRTGPGEDQGRKYELMPAGYAGSANTAKLLSYFSISDVHITDKESPAEALYFGWSASYQAGGLFSQAYSPVCLSTTQVLDAAVQTINALNRQTPFDFGICLGDAANSSQLNELRWFIDVLDGKFITPSSGAHLGADTIDYQQPYQATGLDPAIPWYEAIGNHDQYFMGVAYPTDKVRAAEVGSGILNMDPNTLAPNATEGTGMYVGVVDGTTPYGDVIKGGPSANFTTPLSVTADASRLSMTTATSTTKTYINEFFTTTTLPQGHGFDQSHTGSLAACYSFEPKADLPLKVIVLDDTCKSVSATGGPQYYGGGWIDAERLAWLTAELQKGQDAGQLMIIAAHIPINPQTDLFNATPAPCWAAESLRNETQMIATLQQYPNLILLIAGHRHLNTVTPQPSTDAAHPENGFWEVETPSLRDFPRQIRLFDIRRNSDNSISIITTDVDPAFVDGSPAAKSLGYAIGAYRLFGNTTPTDATSHAYNAELFKQLTPAMQTKIAAYGTPIV